jgi:hypothetical protein
VNRDIREVHLVIDTQEDLEIKFNGVGDEDVGTR